MLILLLVQTSIAGGFYALDGGARGLAQAGAFIASVDDLSAQHYNPAALSQLHGLRCTMSQTMVWQGLEFQPADASEVPLTNRRSIAPVPALACGGASRDGKIAGAFGLFTPIAPPFELGDVHQEEPYHGALLRSHLVQFSMGPTVAFSVRHWLSFGFGVHWAPARFSQEVIAMGCNERGCLEEPIRVEGRDLMRTSAELGALIRPTEWLSIGLSASPPKRVDAEAFLIVDDSPFWDEGCVELEESELCAMPLSVAQRLPWILRAGVAVRPNETLKFELSAVHERWASSSTGVKFQTLPGPPPDQDKLMDLSPFSAFEDVWSARLGGSMQLNAPLTVRAGVAMETSSVSTANESLAQVGGRRWILGAGLTRSFGEGLSADFGYALNLIEPHAVSDSRVRGAVSLDPAAIDYSLQSAGNGQYRGWTQALALGITHVF